MKKILATLLLLTLPATASAMTLTEATDTALENNPNLQNSRHSIEIAEKSLSIARGSRGLSITASGGANASKTKDTPDTQSVSASLKGSIPLYSGKRYESQIKSAEIGIDISKFEYTQAEDDLIYQVARAYIDALENYENTQVYKQTEENMADHEKNISSMYEAGSKAKIDLLRAQVETSNAHQDTVKSNAAYEVSLTELATLMAIDSNSKLTVEHVATSMQLGDLDYYLEQAEENRADLQAATLRVDQGAYSLEVAKSGKRPTLSAEAGVGVGANNTLDWEAKPNASAGLSASWNIFDSGVVKAEIKKAETELEQLNLTRQNELNTIREEVTNAYKNLSTALARLRTTKKAVELAEEEREISIEKYRAGEGILLDVLDSEVSLATAKKNHVSATYDVARYQFDLSHAIGNTLLAIK